MKVAITGSTGFLAQGIIPALESAGHEIVPVVRPGSPRAGVPWDPAAGTIDVGGLDGVDAVVHLTGVGVGDRRWTAARKRLLRESRVDATDLLVDAFRRMERPPRAFISASAIGYYGDRGVQVLDESSAPGAGFLADLCIDWERAALAAADLGVRVATLRTGIVLERGGALFKRLVPAFKFFVGGKLGDGTQYQSWISRADHAAAVAWILEGDVSGPINVTAPEPVTNAEFTRAMAAALRRPAVMSVPKAAIALALGRELADELLASQRAIPGVLARGGFTFQHPTIEAALSDIFA